MTTSTDTSTCQPPSEEAIERAGCSLSYLLETSIGNKRLRHENFVTDNRRVLREIVTEALSAAALAAPSTEGQP